MALARYLLKRNVCLWGQSLLGIRSNKFSTNVEVSVKYPPIQDLSYDARKERSRNVWHKKIQALPTVEEKLIELNMPSYYGWRCLSLNEGLIPYDSLRFSQFITRTHFVESDELPITGENQEISDLAELVNVLLPRLTDILLFECCHKSESHDTIETSIVRQIHWLLMSYLPDQIPHLAEAQVDYDPRVEAYWVAGGMEPTNSTRKARKNVDWLKHRADYPEDRHIQYVGCPMLQLRHPLPLPPVMDLSASKNPSLEVPHFKYDPRVLGLSMTRRHGTIIPGFWPGDQSEFGLVSFHGRNHLKNRPEAYGTDEHAEALHCQAILASFGWIYPIACYQGFSTFNDLTYPLVTQTVITDGQLWSFYKYQLNTTLVHSNHSTNNPRRNICWGTPALKLFDRIEDGKIVGLNEDVLRKILMLYTSKPKKRDINMKPYLSEHHYVANIPDEKKRDWLEKRFKHLYSLRPRHMALPEIYHWEKIYKIDHDTRPMEARRRPFELGINPYKRRLDDHTPDYIPKKHREDKKMKWEKTYYP